ncbi:MAG: hypothetical protein MUF75_06650 [Bacteroidia bacterium]|jgi:hypothetical protein|nr:hypothetical protein [Bacteroidia bacterium]
MKKIFLLILLVLVSVGFYNFSKAPGKFHQTSAIPPKTVYLKHPLAANLDVFFAQTTVFTLYIFQSGSTQDLKLLIKKLSQDKALNSCVTGSVNGDFQAVEVSLKQIQNKAWFVKWLKNAGLQTIKINSDPVKSIDAI